MLYYSDAARQKYRESNFCRKKAFIECWVHDGEDASLLDGFATGNSRASVLGGPRRVAVEAAAGFGWERYLGPQGKFVGMTGFGASAPGDKLYQHFGITADAVAETALATG